MSEGGGRRELTRQIIFEADTPAGKAFDVGLLIAIVASILVVMLESVGPFRENHGGLLTGAEWAITVFFTVELGLRLWSAPFPLRYLRSLYGIIDVLSILPTYLSLIMPGSQSLLVIRALRLLRIFRVLKLVRFLGEADVLAAALRASLPKVVVFLGTLSVMVIIMGTAMYLVEGEENGFTSIPVSIYWAIVTMTTVGYGDIAPQTVLGRSLAAVAMILGYSIIAVPTGIVSAELVRVPRPHTSRVCPGCYSEGHHPSAAFCRDCGIPLAPSPPPAGPPPEHGSTHS